MDQYWLSIEEYELWRLDRGGVFKLSFVDFPDMLFPERFRLSIGEGDLFTLSKFNALKKCALLSGDRFIYMVENDFSRTRLEDFPPLRFKFPVGLSWDEFNNNHIGFPDIAYELNHIDNKDFFVFGDSGKWGVFNVCDYKEHALCIYGFTKELTDIFLSSLAEPDGNIETLKSEIPSTYVNRIVN